MRKWLKRAALRLFCGGVLLSIWFFGWWFLFRDLVSELKTIGVEG